jgi:hypothetical protein
MTMTLVILAVLSGLVFTILLWVARRQSVERRRTRAKGTTPPAVVGTEGMNVVDAGEISPGVRSEETSEPHDQ